MSDDAQAPKSMALLAWLDAIERADNLILEIRHVQETIASQLHIPNRLGLPEVNLDILYEPLRYEDRYLWGRYSGVIQGQEREPLDWFEILDPDAGHLPSITRGASTLAALWCPQYPAADDQPTFYESQLDELDPRYERWFNRTRHTELARSLRLIRIRISTDNRFSANDDRLYDALRHLQLIKRDMLRDKIVLAYRALETFSIRGRSDLPGSIAHFLVVRRAALHSLHLRLDAFNDIVTTVEETLNLSMERDPPPTVRRRRDQGIYTTDLADNCQFITHEVKEFFATCIRARHGSGAPVASDTELEFVVHRYTRQQTSTYRYDHVWVNSLEGGQPVSAGFVQSSFWMPERTDLQPIIAHEVAHLLIKHYYGNLTPFALDKTDDPFGRLLRQIAYVLESYAPRFIYYDVLPRAREALVREIACDLIGVAVHRTSYIFAQFLELICVGSERLFWPFPNGDIAQRVDQIGEEYITYIRDQRPEWLTRITLSLVFSERLRSQDDSRLEYLEKFLHDGVQSVTDAARHEHARWMDREQREDWDTWFEMTCVLRRVVASSDLVDSALAWLAERSKQANVGTGGAPVNRYAPPLPEEIVESCVGAWLDRLVERPRLLGSYLDTIKPAPGKLTYADIVASFRKLYLGAKDSTWSFLRANAPERKLFNHLIDIPWQTAILTAHDFLGVPGVEKHAVPRKIWLSGMHEFNWLGRDLYHAALEYVVWFERRPIGRLKAMNRWLLSIDDAISRLPQSRNADPFLSSIHVLLQRLLGQDIMESTATATYASQLAILAARLKDLFGRSHLGIQLPLGDIGSQLVCRFHPDHNNEITVEPGARPRWVFFFDDLAIKQMNYAAEHITKALRDFFQDASQAGLIDGIGLATQLPIPEDRAGVWTEEQGLYTQYGRAILELIRLAHYLEIRPECKVGRGATAHHDGKGLGNWHAVFGGYLNVPISSRKREGDAGSPVIRQLVPSRSIRVDRLSQTYDAQKPSEGHSSRAHLPGDCVRERGQLFWVPWAPNGVRPPKTQAADFHQTGLQSPLLGRFDWITLDVAKHTARAGQYFPSTPFFRRQQIGVPFTAQISAHGRIECCDEHQGLSKFLQIHLPPAKPDRTGLPVPLATISILLVQRSARLTFVERLLAENLVARSLSNEKILSPYRHFDATRDIGLLTDGWGDIFLVLLAPPKQYGAADFDQYVRQCAEIRTRFHEIITLRKSIFEDTLVVRSETSYTPLAVDTALLRPDLFRTTIFVRFRSTRDGTSLSDEFERHLHTLFDGPMDLAHPREPRKVCLSDILTYSRISGRIDYLITTRQPAAGEEQLAETVYSAICNESGCEFREQYGVIFDTMRRLIFPPGLIEDHVDMTATAIAELKFPMH